MTLSRTAFRTSLHKIVVLCWLFASLCPCAYCADVSEDITPEHLVNLLEKSFAAVNHFTAKFHVKSFRKPASLTKKDSLDELLISEDTWEVRRDGSRWMIDIKNRDLSGGVQGDAWVNVMNYVTPDYGTKSRISVQDSYEEHGDEKVSHSGEDTWIVVANIDPTSKPDRLPFGYFEDGGLLFGYMAADADLPLFEVLRSSRLTLEGDSTVEGHQCKVLKSIGKFGTRLLWLDPEFDYQIVKMEITRQGHDRTNGLEISSLDGSNNDGVTLPKLPLQRMVTVVDDVKFKKIDHRHVMSHFISTLTFYYSDAIHVAFKTVFDLSDISITPSFSDKDFAISLEIPNSTPVSVENSPGILHQWRNGEIVSVFNPKFTKGIWEFATDGQRRISWGRVFLYLNAIIIVVLTVFMILKRRYKHA